jgi:hypothetical protein
VILDNEAVIYEAADGKKLVAGHLPGVPVMGLRVEDPSAECSGEIEVGVDDLEDVTRLLYEAAGRTIPVMLGRPEIDPREGVYIGPLRAWLEGDGEITVALGASQSSAKPFEMRRFASAAVVLADAAEAPGPDAAEVEELAHAVHAATHERGCVYSPTSEQRAFARAALSWMREREAQAP